MPPVEFWMRNWFTNTRSLCQAHTTPRNAPVLTWAPPWPWHRGEKHLARWHQAWGRATPRGPGASPPKMRGDQEPKGRAPTAGEQTGGAGTGTAVLGTSGMSRTGTLSSAGDTRLGTQAGGCRGPWAGWEGLSCATLHSWAGAWHALGT